MPSSWTAAEERDLLLTIIYFNVPAQGKSFGKWNKVASVFKVIKDVKKDAVRKHYGQMLDASILKNLLVSTASDRGESSSKRVGKRKRVVEDLDDEEEEEEEEVASPGKKPSVKMEDEYGDNE